MCLTLTISSSLILLHDNLLLLVLLLRAENVRAGVSRQSLFYLGDNVICVVEIFCWGFLIKQQRRWFVNYDAFKPLKERWFFHLYVHFILRDIFRLILILLCIWKKPSRALLMPLRFSLWILKIIHIFNWRGFAIQDW